MNENRDLPLGDIDQLSLDDERAQKGNKPDGKKQKPEPKKPKKPSEKSEKPVKNHGQSLQPFLLGSIAFLLVSLILISAWFYRELQAVGQQAERSMAFSSRELEELSSLLSATDETFSHSADKIQETLDLHMDEIRKLWDVSNKRNREWIEDNQQAVGKLETQQQQAATTLNSINSRQQALQQDLQGVKDQLPDLQQVRNQLEQQQRTLNQLQTRLELFNESWQRTETRLDEHQQSLQRLSPLMPRLEEVQTAVRNLERRLQNTEEAIQGFDIYRRQLNNRLDRIEGEGPSPEAGSQSSSPP